MSTALSGHVWYTLVCHCAWNGGTRASRHLVDLAALFHLLGGYMRQWGKCGLQAMVLLLVSSGSYAASFDCQHAVSVVEKSICQDDDVSTLDSQMADAYARAHGRAGAHADALLRDQRIWLSQRNAAVVENQGMASDIYKRRIAFLDKLFQDKEPPSPLLAAIDAHIAAHPKASEGRADDINVWNVIGGDGSVFTTAREMPVKDAKSLPFHLDDAQKLIGSDESVDDYSTLALLDADRLGGLYAEEGTMQAVYWKLFRWNGQAVQGVDVPLTLSHTEWTNVGGLVDYKGVAYALSDDDGSLDRTELIAQLFANGQWGDDVELELHYDVHLQSSSSYCTEADCAALKTFADKFIRQFDQGHDVSPLQTVLSVDESQHYEALLRHAKADRDEILDSLPAFGGKIKYADNVAYKSFAPLSYYFPVRWQGELLLGRIGNASLGWRESEDLLLAIWRWDGQAFVPVLGMVTTKARGDFLLGEWSSGASHPSP
jgi:uncharacterized protein